MKHFSALLSRLQKIKNQHGFTMIELLIVISILGILAVAVLSAINPVEQINRGRDTGSRSDAEQLLSAIDRYNAFQGYVPWVRAANADTDQAFIPVDNTTWFDTENGVATDCLVLDKLSAGSTGGAVTCPASDELKESFITRISEPSYNPLYVYNNGNTGDSTYICFEPQSGAFQTEAQTRCDNYNNNVVTTPSDFPLAEVCATNYSGDAAVDPLICLP